MTTCRADFTLRAVAWAWTLFLSVFAVVAARAQPPALVGSARTETPTQVTAGKLAPRAAALDRQLSRRVAQPPITAPREIAAGPRERVAGASPEEVRFAAQRFDAGDADFQVSLGFLNIVYPSLEAGVDLAALDAGEVVTFSLGARAGIGYYLLGDLLSELPKVDSGPLAPTEIEVDAWHWQVSAELLMHLPWVAWLLDDPGIDYYVGFVVGRSVYTFTGSIPGDPKRTSARRVVLGGGVAMGARVTPSPQSAWFGFGHATIILEHGVDPIEVTDSMGNTAMLDPGDYTAGGPQLMLGGGVHL